MYHAGRSGRWCSRSERNDASPGRGGCSTAATPALRCFTDDYAAFVGLFEPACERLRMRILGYCLMPNHFHLLLRPYADGDLGRRMQWLMTSHVRRYHRHYGSSGHIWQGRFKAFPIQEDEHFLAVLRYVERNALRAKLVKRAEDWPWGSLRARTARGDRRLPIPRQRQGRPYGSETWTKRAARLLGLESTLRPRGRPRKDPTK
jgi:putative transposase